MVQILGRLALSIGHFIVAGLGGLARPRRFLRDRVPDRARHSGDLGQRAPCSSSSRPASSGRRTGASSAAASCSALVVTALALRRCSVQPGDRVRHLDGGRHRHARARHGRHRPTRRGSRSSMRRSSSSPSARRRASARATAGSPSTCLGFDEAFYGTLAADRRRHRARRGLAALGRHHAQAGRDRAALADDPRHASFRCPRLLLVYRLRSRDRSDVRVRRARRSPSSTRPPPRRWPSSAWCRC